MKKIVLKIGIVDEKNRRKILKSIAGFQGVESVAVDVKENKVIVIGEMDPVFLTSKLRRFVYTELLSAGPAKEVGVVSTKEVKVGSAKDEKSYSENTTTAGAPQLYYPPNDKYRPFEYTVVTDENSNACVIS